MKPTATERLSTAIALLLIRIHNSCKINEESEIRFGLCTVTPKHSAVRKPSAQVQKEIEHCAKEHFQKLDAVGVYLRYWTPPLSPDADNREPIGDKEDYHLSFELPIFDARFEQELIARALIFCPADSEMFRWDDWFELQLEALRFTPLLYQGLKEDRIVTQIRYQLALKAEPFFKEFVYGYALKDKHLNLSKSEIIEWEKKTADWTVHYSNARNIIRHNVSVYDCYKACHKKMKQTRNPKLQALLREFTYYIELRLIRQSGLPQMEIEILIEELRDLKGLPRHNRTRYKAKRPSLCLSDIECAQFLYQLIQEFGKEPRSQKALGETILFIWLSQHAAFSGQSFQVQDVLSILVKDIDFGDGTISIANNKFHINKGLLEILSAWIGNSDRVNKRRLFSTLNYDVLEKLLKKYSLKFLGVDGRLQPRDFMMRVHVVQGARMDNQMRQQLANQELLVANSPYRIRSSDIKKQILSSVRQKAPLGCL